MWFWLQFENSDHTTNQRTEQSHTHTHTHTHTYLLQGIIGKIIVLNLRAEVTIKNLIFLS